MWQAISVVLWQAISVVLWQAISVVLWQAISVVLWQAISVFSALRVCQKTGCVSQLVCFLSLRLLLA